MRIRAHVPNLRPYNPFFACAYPIAQDVVSTTYYAVYETRNRHYELQPLKPIVEPYDIRERAYNQDEN